VISWDVPNRPRNRNLFCAGEEILFFRRDQPADLAVHIRRLQQEPEWARQLAVRAQAKVAAFHTIEKRIRQVLDWVATGLEPDYGESAANDASPFIEDPSPNPNADEAARWAGISALIEKIVSGETTQKPRRILDVGCGRGWLAGLAAKFGESEGVESTPAIVAQARRLFPHLRFMEGTAEMVLNAPDFQPYDFVLASDMIEYVPQERQSEYVRELGRLLKPGGHVILTTARGESLQEWARLWGGMGRPAEDWLVEPALRQLFERENFGVAGHERVFFNTARRRFVSSDEAKTDGDALALYQVWAFQLPGPPEPVVRPETVLAEYHRARHAAAARALQLLPDDPFLLTDGASALLDLGEPEAARQLLAWLVALEANHAPARRLLARALLQLGRAPEAKAQTERAAEIEAQCPAPVVSIVIPAGGGASSLSLLRHVHEAKLLDGSPARLETRTAVIHGRAAPCIHLHPATRLRFAVPSPGPGRFTCAISLHPEAWNKPAATGCEFFIHSDGREIFHAEIAPRRLPADRRWHEVEIEMPAARGPFHEFILRTKEMGSSPDFRRAVWCDPVFHPQSAPTAKLT
jgi:SAM-dependent methyltransferase